MKRTVNHMQLFLPTGFGGTVNTTLCGRVDNSQADYNVADEVTCKHCQKAMNTPWGKAKMARAVR